MKPLDLFEVETEFSNNLSLINRIDLIDKSFFYSNYEFGTQPFRGEIVGVIGYQ